MKRLGKKLVLLCGICLCSMMIFTVNHMPVYASGGEGTGIEDNSRATNLEWVYATINGVLYMRLYNHTTGEWMTDWVPAVG